MFVVEGVLEEIVDECGVVVLENDVDDGVGEFVFYGYVYVVFYVCFDDECGEGWVIFVVWVGVVVLIFGVVFGFFGFVDVVEKSVDVGEEWVGVDGVGGVFGELGDD